MPVIQSPNLSTLYRHGRASRQLHFAQFSVPSDDGREPSSGARDKAGRGHLYRHRGHSWMRYIHNNSIVQAGSVGI